MKFKIKNVGKIHSAEIEVAGITVIAGYNNTGKTTILRSVDTMLKTYCNLEENILGERIKSVYSALVRTEKYYKIGDLNVPFEMLYSIAGEICKLMQKRQSALVSKEECMFIVSESMKNHAEENGFEYSNDENTVDVEEFAEEICAKILEISKRKDTVYQKYLAEINLRRTFKRQANNLLNGMISEIDIISDKGCCSLEFQNNKLLKEEGSALENIPVIYIETRNVLDEMSFRYREVDEQTRELRRMLMHERSLNKDEISFEQYEEVEKNIDTVKEIFKEVLHGELRIEKRDIEYKEDLIDEPIQIGNVASGMKLFLLLQRLMENGILKKNSWLLIDEPESNLHPDWHLKLAEILILLKLRMNMHILISSHSPYFMRALEVKMADYGVKDMGRYYLMEEENSMFLAKNVTHCTEAIYKQLYKPLEML